MAGQREEDAGCLLIPSDYLLNHHLVQDAYLAGFICSTATLRARAFFPSSAVPQLKNCANTVRISHITCRADEFVNPIGRNLDDQIVRMVIYRGTHVSTLENSLHPA